MAEYAIGSVSTLAFGVFNGEGQNVTANPDSTLWIGRATVRPVAFVTLGANVAGHGSDSTRYGMDAVVEYLGAAFTGEYIGQDRDPGGLDDKGWYAQGT